MNKIPSIVRAAWILIAAALFAPCWLAAKTPGQPASPARFILPMKDHGGRPVLDIVISGKGPFSFILDTAASGAFP